MYKSWFLCNQTAKMCRQEVLLDKCVEAYRTNVHFMFSIHSQVTTWVVLLIRQNNTFCPPSKGSYIILESNNYNSCSLRYSTSPHYLGGQQPKTVYHTTTKPPPEESKYNSHSNLELKETHPQIRHWWWCWERELDVEQDQQLLIGVGWIWPGNCSCGGAGEKVSCGVFVMMKWQHREIERALYNLTVYKWWRRD